MSHPHHPHPGPDDPHGHHHGAGHAHGGGCGGEVATTETDPVCGMKVDPATTPHHAEHGGRAFHFCSAGCRTKFIADPDRYLRPARPAAAPAPAGAVYTCPMHPEVRQVGPGTCPKCGMALEPETLAEGPEDDSELNDMSRRLWIGLALTAPVFALEMGGHLLGRPLLAGWAAAWLPLVLASPVVLWAGAPFFHRAWLSLVHRSLNMFTLIALGVGAAYAYSLAAVLAPQIFPDSVRDHHGAIPLYFEAAAVITVLALLGQVLELRARRRTSGAIRALMALAPKTARRIRPDGTDEDAPLAEIAVGDRLRIRPGEKIPVDGEILEGRAAVDESLVTGESMPVARQAGDAVIGGSLNTTGAFVMRADKVGADTVLARIVQMVAQAQRSRAPVQRLADQVSAWFVPAVLAVAAAAFAGWLWLGPQPRLAHALVAAVSVLIVACPCALGLATPISIMVGVGRGARAGVLIKDAQALERLARIDTLVVDKTGTLTEGRPALVDMTAAPGLPPDEILRLIASLERASEHPIAAALVAAATDRGLALAQPQNVDSPVGKGVVGEVDGRRLAAGSARFLTELGVDPAALDGWAEPRRGQGATVIFAAVDGALAGAFAVADPVKASAADAVAALKAQGVRLVMMTGDGRATAQAVAERLGIDEIEAEVAPERKAEVVQRLRGEGRRVAMAGDGVNDAPALAAAEVGIAMGGGADVAMESAGVTLLGGDLAGLLRARRLSRAVMGNIRQNLVFAFVYNLAGVPLAAGLLYPLTGLTLSPALAALAMSLSSVSVIGNALRLQAAKL